jgi:hypothetical protein
MSALDELFFGVGGYCMLSMDEVLIFGTSSSNNIVIVVAIVVILVVVVVIGTNIVPIDLARLRPEAAEVQTQDSRETQTGCTPCCAVHLL